MSQSHNVEISKSKISEHVNEIQNMLTKLYKLHAEIMNMRDVPHDVSIPDELYLFLPGLNMFTIVEISFPKKMIREVRVSPLFPDMLRINTIEYRYVDDDALREHVRDMMPLAFSIIFLSSDMYRCWNMLIRELEETVRELARSCEKYDEKREQEKFRLFTKRIVSRSYTMPETSHIINLLDKIRKLLARIYDHYQELVRLWDLVR